MSRKIDEHDRSKLAREALRRATDGPAPRVDRLVGAVPEMLAEARRRMRDAPADPVADLVPLAWKALPRLASVAALLLLGCAALLLAGNGSSVDAGAQDLDRMIVTGGVAGGDQDPLLEALLFEEDGDG
ncbi:MAG: hypothetical protein OEQ13_00575 [Acidobacteriota bacterium]|nr:hypothetical protein [Acidobacteriota bacterium]